MVSKLKLEVDVDVKGTDKLSGLSSKMGAVGGTLSKFVTLPLLGAGAAIAGLAADAQTSAAKLNAAFKNMGSTSGRSLEQLQQQATALGEATTFDDEGIMEAQAALLTFGTVSGEAFDRTIQGAADLAAATGTDLTTATRTLGKALADPVAGMGKLAKAGVVLTDAEKEQVTALTEAGDKLGAQNVILDAVEQRYAGVNAELQNTAAGAGAQAFEDLVNAGEDLGSIFLPILASLAQGLSGIVRAFTALPEPVKTFIVVLAGVVAAVGPALVVGSKLVGAFKTVGTAFNILKVAMLANPFVALAVAVAAIAALIILNWDKIVGVFKVVWATITKGFQGLADALATTWKVITDVAVGAWNLLGDIIKGGVNAVIDVVNAFLGFLNGISFGAGPWDVGPIHIDAISIDPFNVPLIPRLAEGGIISRPTLALLGERGPEAVVPLGNPIGETHFHSHINVTAEDPFIRNEDDLIRTNRRIAFLEGF